MPARPVSCRRSTSSHRGAGRRLHGPEPIGAPTCAGCLRPQGDCPAPDAMAATGAARRASRPAPAPGRRGWGAGARGLASGRPAVVDAPPAERTRTGRMPVGALAGCPRRPPSRGRGPAGATPRPGRTRGGSGGRSAFRAVPASAGDGLHRRRGRRPAPRRFGPGGPRVRPRTGRASEGTARLRAGRPAADDLALRGRSPRPVRRRSVLRPDRAPEVRAHMPSADLYISITASSSARSSLSRLRRAMTLRSTLVS